MEPPTPVGARVLVLNRWPPAAAEEPQSPEAEVYSASAGSEARQATPSPTIEPVSVAATVQASECWPAS